MSYNSNGANFVINKASNAPTMSATKYIFFGKVTIVTKASPGTGIVSSFVLESDDLDEIDWEWLGHDDATVQSNFYGKGNTTTYDRAIYHPVASPIGAWHEYTIDWTSSAITWSIDGSVIRTLPYGDPLALGGYNYPQTPMRVKLGSWVGCASAEAAADPLKKGTCEWAGGPADFSQAPFTMLVKSISIEDYGCATSYTYGDNSGSFESIQSTGGCKGGSGSGTGSGSSSSSVSSTKSSSTKASSTKATSTVESSTAAPTTTSASSTSTQGPSNSTISSTGTGTGSPTSNPSSTGTSPPELNAASSIQRRFGAVDYIVGALGLGLGYLVM